MSDDLFLDMVILDLEFVKIVLNFIIVDIGMDVLIYVIEVYVFINFNDFLDVLVEKVIKLVFKYLIKVYKDGNDIEVWEKMYNVFCLVGMVFN